MLRLPHHTPTEPPAIEFIGDDLPDDVLDVLAGILIDAWEADHPKDKEKK